VTEGGIVALFLCAWVFTNLTFVASGFYFSSAGKREVARANATFREFTAAFDMQPDGGDEGAGGDGDLEGLAAALESAAAWSDGRAAS